ncbi:MAG: AAA family ATPase [Desulfomonilaceae bacterium]|nr:AAA family ATPase [Desulfomonilaceae bacterium]
MKGIEMDFDKDLEIYFRSRFTLICIPSLEEECIIDRIERVCRKTDRRLYAWDHGEFFRVILGEGAPPSAKDPLSALTAMENLPDDSVFVLLDFHQCWNGQPRVVRKLRDLAQRFRFIRKTIILTMPFWRVPDELKDDAVMLEFPSPGIAELDDILSSLTAAPGVRFNLTPQGREKLLAAALGLSTNHARRIFSKAIISKGGLDERDIDLVNREKKQVVRESGALEFFTPSETIADVGGLDELKEWLRMRERAFTQEARDYGLPAPKGIALIGIPGTGKSLTAKMIADLWRLPLLRLDLGALFAGLVGQSEENTRRALSLAETVAPCLLWIDEIEKGLSVGGGDAGTSMRVFASILSWMQEKTRPVFVVATANNISLLPAELLRRGRVDEIFFLDLPSAAERREIFQVHIRKRKRPVQGYDLDALVEASDGYVGAEIEQAVIDAMYRAFSDRGLPGRDFTTGDILAALSRQVPISRSQRETVRDLRQWLAEGRAQSASIGSVGQA